VNLLFCGQLIRRKGFDLLLEAFKKLLEDESLGDDIELTVVGAGELEYLLEEISDNARSRIHHMGFLQPGELSGIFARADIFVLPSRYDGWGVVVNQAIAAQLAIVTTDAVGAAEYVSEENGYIVPSEDVDALVNAIKQLILNQDAWPAIRKFNAALTERISPEYGARRIFEFLKKVNTDR
ncbi:MAG: glycosyltransferase family 4 protein, partial [Verrucomicrobiota bacterium]